MPVGLGLWHWSILNLANWMHRLRPLERPCIILFFSFFPKLYQGFFWACSSSYLLKISHVDVYKKACPVLPDTI